MHILITGGAGFIGSHLADELLRRGHRVRALDLLAPQVHGDDAGRPSYLDDDVELIRGDVRDRQAVASALEGVEAVYHFAAAVGVGQSMYEIGHYVSTNNLGTATLLEALIRHPVRKLVVASSMSIYGEGLYQRADGGSTVVAERDLDRLKRGQWEVYDEHEQPLRPLPTPESKPPALSSIYALSKFDQERMCLMLGRAYGIPTVALRFFNVYGTRQALSNPYTGVLAIFASRLLNGNRPLIFEDGRQQRDFVSVHDIVRACCLALESDAAVGQAINVASGRASTVLDVAALLGATLGKTGVAPDVSGRYRVGDVRHCIADISRARELLGYTPQVSLEDGLKELAAWLAGQTADDRVAEARAELTARGLAV